MKTMKGTELHLKQACHVISRNLYLKPRPLPDLSEYRYWLVSLHFLVPYDRELLISGH